MHFLAFGDVNPRNADIENLAVLIKDRGANEIATPTLGTMVCVDVKVVTLPMGVATENRLDRAACKPLGIFGVMPPRAFPERLVYAGFAWPPAL